MIHVTNPDIPELAVYGGLSESQLNHYYEPDPGIFIAESEKVIRRALDGGYEPLSFLVDKSVSYLHQDLFSRYQVPVYEADLSIMNRMTASHLTNGLLSAMRRKAFPSVREFCANAKRIVILEKVENPTNVGAIFRSAAALGMDGILVSEGASDPLYRRSARVSMGCVFQMPWIKLNKKKSPLSHALQTLKEMDFRIIGMALHDDTIDLDHVSACSDEKIAIILGNEGYGITNQTLSYCDQIVKIPMAHQVDSLNVATAAAITFWHLR